MKPLPHPPIVIVMTFQQKRPRGVRDLGADDCIIKSSGSTLADSRGLLGHRKLTGRRRLTGPVEP
jgi:hypothetical protein